MATITEQRIARFLEDICYLKRLGSFHARLALFLMKVVNEDSEINLNKALSEELAIQMDISTRYMKKGVAELLEVGLLMKVKHGVYQFSGQLPAVTWDQLHSVVENSNDPDGGINISITYPALENENSEKCIKPIVRVSIKK